MPKLMIAITVLFCNWFGVSNIATAQSAQDVYSTASPFVVTVVTTDAQGNPLGTGSGVLVGPNRVITNWHVVEHGSAYIVRRKDTNYKAALVSDRRDRDLALLGVQDLEVPGVQLARGTNLKVGQAVYAIGAPSGLELTLTSGLISGLRPVEGGQLIQTSAAISPGSSGGGLFNEKSELVGITTLKLTGSSQEGLGFAVPTEWVNQLLDPELTAKSAKHSKGLNGVTGFLILFGVLIIFAFGKRIAHMITDRFASTDFHTQVNMDNEPDEISSTTKHETDTLSPELAKFGLIASREFDSGKVKPLVLETARAKSNGSDELAKQHYIRLRAEQLSKQFGSDSRDPTDKPTKREKIININIRSFTAFGVALLGVCLLAWMTVQFLVDDPVRDTNAYRIQSLWLKVSESSYSNDSLLAKANSYYGSNEYTKSQKIYKYLEREGNYDAAYHLGLMFWNGYGMQKDALKAIDMYKTAAKSGHVEANLLLGHAYRLGEGVKLDPKVSVNYYRVAADKNNAEAQGLMSEAYLNGNGVPQEYTDGYKWAKSGAEGGDLLAQYNLGLILIYGYGTPKKFDEGIEWLEKAATKDYPGALVKLADIYGTVEGYIDNRKMEAYLLRAAQAEDPEALYKLGNIYSNGRITPPDTSRAAEFYIRSCKKNYGPGCWQLGTSYWNGYGLAKDQEEGMKWYRKAIDLGSLDALMDVGKIYWDGSKSFPKNEKYALDLFLKAAAAGKSDSHGYIAVAYLFGRGVAKNLPEAFKWLEPIAQEGDSTAQAWLGEMYFYGGGVAQDFAKGFDWATKSANAGNLRGKLVLGQMYIKGDPNRQDFEKGKNLIRQVALTGEIEAIEEMASLEINGKPVNVGGIMQRSGIDMTSAWAWYSVAAKLGSKTYKERFDLLERAYPPPDYRRAKGLADKYLDAIYAYQAQTQNGDNVKSGV